MVVSELSISKEETAHIAELARLSLNESELAQAQHDLSEIIDYMNKIAGLNTDGGGADHSTLSGRQCMARGRGSALAQS